MKINIKFINLLILVGGLVSACSTAPRSDISRDANLREEVQKLNLLIEKGDQDHFSVLSPDDFKKSKELSKKVKKQIDNDISREKILNTLSEAKGYFERAQKNARKVENQVHGILEARQHALNAGARNLTKKSVILNDLDNELQELIDNIEDMSADDYNSLRSRYLQLEIASTQSSELGLAKEKVNSVRDKAEDQAPRSLDRALKDIANAENMITANVRSPYRYKSSVERANKSAQFLTDVVMASEQDGEVVPESVAIELVQKRRKSQSQQSRLSDQETTLEHNREMKSIAKDFSQEEAEVYRQGNNIVIRLKGIKFSTGRAELPGESVALLEKVRNVAKDLNSQEITIEGHTDNVGGSKINKALSQKRAKAVANYLAASGIRRNSIRTVGHSFEKPLASNKTKSGRAKNRRVDVIITPEGSEESQFSTYK